jgi:hypothetical protein
VPFQVCHFSPPDFLGVILMLISRDVPGKYICFTYRKKRTGCRSCPEKGILLDIARMPGPGKGTEQVGPGKGTGEIFFLPDSA